MAVGKQWYAPVNGREEAKETGHQLEMAEDTHFQAIRRTSGRAIRLMVGAVIGLLLFGSLFASMLPAGRGVGRSLPRFWTMAAKDDLWGQKLVDWKPPSNLKVVGMVFFGRSRTASVLNCYVQRNLKSNGGLLDEVVWIEGTDEQRELDWLRSIVKETPGYRTWSIPDFVNQEVKAERHYQHAYNIANEEKHPGEVVFVKIDDDIVFVEDSAIPAIVQRALSTNALIVSANVVNSPALAWVHYSLGAVEGYMPELYQTDVGVKPANARLSFAQRYADEPYWDGPPDFRVPDNYQPAYPRHRWLPISLKTHFIDQTPIASIDTFNSFGNSLFQWKFGAQNHYSLLGRLRRNDVAAYKFQTWDFNTGRMGIQFFAVTRQTLRDLYPFPIRDDELYLSEQAPKETKRHAIMDGRGLVAHYSYQFMKQGMDTTDVIDRYRAFAEDGICVAPTTVANGTEK